MELSAIARYCTCGSSLTGRADKPEVLEAAWAEFHSGEGHGPTDAAGAAAARRRQERDEQAAAELGIAPEKWAVMNRAERRAAKHAHK